MSDSKARAKYPLTNEDQPDIMIEFSDGMERVRIEINMEALTQDFNFGGAILIGKMEQMKAQLIKVFNQKQSALLERARSKVLMPSGKVPLAVQ